MKKKIPVCRCNVRCISPTYCFMPHKELRSFNSFDSSAKYPKLLRKRTSKNFENSSVFLRVNKRSKVNGRMSIVKIPSIIFVIFDPFLSHFCETYRKSSKTYQKSTVNCQKCQKYTRIFEKCNIFDTFVSFNNAFAKVLGFKSTIYFQQIFERLNFWTFEF